MRHLRALTSLEFLVVAVLATGAVVAAGPAMAQAQGTTRARDANAIPAGYSSLRVLVLPVQSLRADSVGFDVAAWDKSRRAFDDSLGAAIARTGIGKGWGYAADVARSAKRNAMYSGDPYALGVPMLVKAAALEPREQIADLLASNLRPLIALGDTRFALVPYELVLERRTSSDAGPLVRPRLRLVLIDGRSATLMWSGEVTGEAAGANDPALFNALIAKVAAMVAPR